MSVTYKNYPVIRLPRDAYDKLVVLAKRNERSLAREAEAHINHAYNKIDSDRLQLVLNKEAP